MTIIIAAREFIAADSKLSSSDGSEAPLTVGKILKRKGGGLFATAGDSRRTHHFEMALKAGRQPKDLDPLEDEDFAGVLLKPDKTLTYFDVNFAPFPFAEEWVALGCAHQVARSWLLNGNELNLVNRAITAIHRCIEVDSRCGYPILIAYLNGKHELIAGPQEKRRKRG